MGSNNTYDIPVVATGTNAPSTSLINDDADGRTFEFVSTVVSDKVDIYGSADGVAFPPIVNTTPLLTLGGNSPPKTLTDRSLKYRAVFSGSGTRSLKVRAGTGCCAGDAGQHFNTLPLPNFPVGGVIGTAAATVDQFAAFTFDQSTAGQTLTFPAPTDPTATYVRWVSNIGTQSFILYGLIVLPGAGTKLVWNGTAWFNGCTGTASPTRTVMAAAGRSVIESDGTTDFIGGQQPGRAVLIGAGTGDFSVMVVGGKIAMNTDGVGPINIATDPIPQVVNIGNLDPASGIAMRAGLGWAVQGGTIAIGSGAGPGGTIVVDSGTTGAMNWGTGPNAKVLTFGNSTLTTSIALNVGTGGLLLGANGTDHATTVGSLSGASPLAVRAGTGGLTIVNNGATWTWPTALGAAGTKLTDAAGNGVLSFAL